MENVGSFFIILGGLFLTGLVIDLLGRHSPLPRVTLLIVFGVLIGPSGFDLLPEITDGWFSMTADAALVMVGFLLGGKLTGPSLRLHGRLVLWVSVVEVVVTTASVLVGLLLIGIDAEIALILAGISAATAPAAISDVVHETEADGPFTRTLLGVVVIDDAWGLLMFSFFLGAAQFLAGTGETMDVLYTAVWEISGALAVGVAVGLPGAFLTGRVQPGEPTLVEAIGLVFLCGGVALWLEVSFLLASMVLGCVIANLAKHHNRPFHAIEGIEWPFLILFFVFAGTALDLGTFTGVGLLGVCYVAFRIAGRLVGGVIGTTLGGGPRAFKGWMGLSLLPQAGIALGMALVAAERFPQYHAEILTTATAATVFFEIIGPIATKRALVRVGEVGMLEDAPVQD